MEQFNLTQIITLIGGDVDKEFSLPQLRGCPCERWTKNVPCSSPSVPPLQKKFDFVLIFIEGAISEFGDAGSNAHKLCNSLKLPV